MPNPPAVLARLEATGLVPVFYHPDVNVSRSVITAAADAGLRAVEFTNRGENAPEQFDQLQAFIAERGYDVRLGAGTVLDAATAEGFIARGAGFIVSPVLDPLVGEVCRRRGVAWMPGCGTATECQQAYLQGATLIKIFPGAVLGPAFVSATLAPLPHLKLMPTGGVEPTEASLKAWFDAGVRCVGMGSPLLGSLKAPIDVPALTAQIRTVCERIQAVRRR